MADSNYRSFRFTHPEWEDPGSPGFGIAPGGGLAMVEDSEAIRQSIFMILSTSPGERVMRPEFGCRVHWLVFSPVDDTTAGLAIHYVTQSLRRWEPRIDLLSVDANTNPDDVGLMLISIHYQVKATQELVELAWTLNMGAI